MLGGGVRCDGGHGRRGPDLSREYLKRIGGQRIMRVGSDGHPGGDTGMRWVQMGICQRGSQLKNWEIKKTDRGFSFREYSGKCPSRVLHYSKRR